MPDRVEPSVNSDRGLKYWNCRYSDSRIVCGGTIRVKITMANTRFRPRNLNRAIP